MENLLTIQEVIKQLAELDPPIELKESAIRQYISDKLACEPKIEGSKGKGRKTLYYLLKHQGEDLIIRAFYLIKSLQYHGVRVYLITYGA